jgi:hypothetical protein
MRGGLCQVSEEADLSAIAKVKESESEYANMLLRTLILGSLISRTTSGEVLKQYQV